MDSEYFQSIRHKLHKRRERLNSANRESLQFALNQTWGFFQDNEIIKGILDGLERRVPEANKWANEVFMNHYPVYPNTEIGNNARCYWIVKQCVERTNSDDPELRHENEQFTGFQGFCENYVEPLFDFLEEQINDKRITLFLLKKYKHRCEWFRREQLESLSVQGESTLVRDLYEYLHDQGIEFHIEPKSASGRPDLISAQSGKDRLLADAKIFNPERSQDASHNIEGFHQIYEYARDYNEPVGYLVIFKSCERDLAIPTQSHGSAFPFITHNNKMIFFVIVDIFVYDKSASERGKLKAYEILPERFTESLSGGGR